MTQRGSGGGRYAGPVLTLWLGLLACGTAPLDGEAVPNRLADATSPYLLRHADDPVAWHPWGDEPFALAAARDQLVLLSIGYATCHWCHVMERESFEDPEVAAFINARFVSVKVDREERPDVDAHYIEALQALTGRAGWPATLVLTPAGEPVYAASYLPARDGDRPGLRGLLNVLSELAQAWESDRATLLAHVEANVQRLSARRTDAGVGEVGDHALHDHAQALLGLWDREHGGFGGAPKFPRPTVISYLLRFARRTGDAAPRDAALHALRSMARSPVYDQLGGGFHRYAVDRAWQQPHFEKMLVDQALLAMAYLEGYQVSGDPELARVARETLEFVVRELSLPEGGFASAIDADSLVGGELVEGAFYTWTAEQVAAALGPDASALSLLPDGLLHAPPPSALRQRLYQARQQRPAPAIDDKAVTAWNGLMISALARGALVLDEEAWVHRARQAARFLVRANQTRDGRLRRSWRAGRAAHDGVLEDYTFLAQGLLDLHEATGDPEWLRQAAALQARADELFGAPDGAWFRTATPDPRLIRAVPLLDGTEPSGTGVGILVHLRLAELLAEGASHRAHADRALARVAPTLNAQGHAATVSLSALEHALDLPRQIVLIGEPGPERDALRRVVAERYLPNRALLVASEAEAASWAELIPLLDGKTALGEPTAYVCERGLCEAPTTHPDVLAAQLQRVEPLPSDAR